MATNIKYLDLTGLGKYNDKLQSWVIGKINSNNEDHAGDIAKGVSAYNAWVKFLSGTFTDTPVPTLADINSSLINLSNNKADKATTLSGYGITDAYTTTETNDAISTEINKVKTTVSKDGSLVSLTTGGTGANMTISVDETGLDAALSSKANKATTLSGYGITDAYTKTEVDSTVDGINKSIEDILNAIEGGTHFIGVKDKLEDVSNPENGDIVIVGNKEYIYDASNTGDKWIELGDTTEEGNRISAIEKVLGNDTDTTIATRITNAINDLDVDANDTTPTTGYDVKAISQISQTDGKISVDAYVNIGSITEAEIDTLNWD